MTPLPSLPACNFPRTSWHVSNRWVVLTFLATLGWLFILEPALAQSTGGASLEPIDNAAKQLERFLRGPFAKTVMAIAIALTGYACATGRAPWFWFGLCIIACALIFGAPKIVEFFSQGQT
jgi:type IV secretory pathway VirB2 component (pilin)